VIRRWPAPTERKRSWLDTSGVVAGDGARSATCSASSPGPGEVTVAGGVFAPGHLGELTQYLAFELVDDVLAETRTVQRRLRDLPSRAGVYFVLALGMFPQPGYLRVRGKLTTGLAGLRLRRRH
jgi:Insertion element 4 transposase N-terminal